MRLNLTQYRVDLKKLNGSSGEFPCPKCYSPISPDDESDTTYDIVKSTVKDRNLETITVQCRKCGCTIVLEGFQ
jgi:predicted nucleic-acid-binding Zn-ribbon protein